MLPTIQLPGGWTLCTFTVAASLAFAFFVVYVYEQARARGWGRGQIIGFFFAGFPATYLGARLGYFAFYDPAGLKANPWVLFGDEPGLCFFGGLLGLLAVSAGYLRAVGLPAGTFLGLTTPALAVGHAIGRAGCLMAGCCYGRVTHLPWAFA